MSSWGGPRARTSLSVKTVWRTSPFGRVEPNDG